jgi:hypothetical protein
MLQHPALYRVNESIRITKIHIYQLMVDNLTTIGLFSLRPLQGILLEKGADYGQDSRQY